jgi:hypothetical protein
MKKNILYFILIVLIIAVTGRRLYLTFVDDGMPVDQIIIFLPRGSDITVAEQIAESIDGKVHTLIAEDQYVLDVPTKTPYGRDSLIRRLSHDKRIEVVTTSFYSTTR